MTIKNDIAKKRLLSLVGTLSFAVLFMIPIVASTTTTGQAEVMEVMVEGDDVFTSAISFNGEDIFNKKEMVSSVLEEKIAIFPEFDFSKVEETAYLIENTNLKIQPYDDAEEADFLEKYQEIKLIGKNELTYWEVSYNDNIYYIDSTTITTDKATVENMQEQERIAREEAERKAAEAKRKAEEEAKRKAEEAAKKKAEEEARKKAKERSASTYNTTWNGSKLTKSKGVNYGPSGKETYYNLNMSGVVSIMRNMGNTDEYWVRDDGCKMLGNYIMVAANLNVHPRGSLVETSLGTGIVCDTGGFAKNNPYQLDIAVNW